MQDFIYVIFSLICKKKVTEAKKKKVQTGIKKYLFIFK